MIRNEEVSNTAAESIFHSGKKVHWTKIFLSPIWAFVNGYFLRLGFFRWPQWINYCNTYRQPEL